MCHRALVLILVTENPAALTPEACPGLYVIEGTASTDTGDGGTATARISVAVDGTQSNDTSFDSMISRNGRYVVFAQSRPSGSTAAEGLRVYERGLLDGTTQWVSQPNTATETYCAGWPVISAGPPATARSDRQRKLQITG